MAMSDARTLRTSSGRHQGRGWVAGGAGGRSAAGSAAKAVGNATEREPVADRTQGPLARQGPNRRWRCVVAPLYVDMQDACRFKVLISRLSTIAAGVVAEERAPGT